MRLYIYVNDDVNDVYFLRLKVLAIYIVLYLPSIYCEDYFVKFIIVNITLQYCTIIIFEDDDVVLLFILIKFSRSSAPIRYLLLFVAQHKEEKNINNISLFFYIIPGIIHRFRLLICIIL